MAQPNHTRTLVTLACLISLLGCSTLRSGGDRAPVDAGSDASEAQGGSDAPLPSIVGGAGAGGSGAGSGGAGSGGKRADTAGSGGAGGAGSGGKRADTSGSGGAGTSGGGGKSGSSSPAVFEVLRSQPEDGATLDDPSAPVEVYFTRPLDKGSVTTGTFKIPVSGQLSVADDHITFKPDARWTLSDDYTVDLTSGIFSQDQAPLPKTSIHFHVRAGKWTRERVETGTDSRGFERPLIAASGSGQIALSWNSDFIGSRHTAAVTKRRNADGSWTSLADGTGSLGGSAGALVLSEGQVVYGSNPDDSGNWSLSCADAGGTVMSVPKPAGDTVQSGERIAGLASAYSDVLILQQLSSAFSIITSGCTSDHPVLTWKVPIASSVSASDVQFTRPGVAVWTQWNPNEPTDAGYPNTSVWGVSNGGAPDCVGNSGCPSLLSAQDALADSAALVEVSFTNVLLWRQDQGGSSEVWSRTNDLTDGWHAPARLSSAMTPARDPSLASGGNGALAVWIETPADGPRVAGASMASLTWSSPTLLSSASPAMAVGQAEIASDAIGSGMAVWAQSNSSDTNSYNSYDVIAVPYRRRDGWKTSEAFTLSISHAASAQVSVAMSGDGRAFATWIESQAVWFGRYD